MIKIAKIRPLYWITGIVGLFLLFMAGSFMYVWNQAEGDRVNATFESNLKMNEDFGFSTIKKKLTEDYQPDIEDEKRPEIDRVVRHEKQLREKKVNQEEQIKQLQTHLDTLTARYAKLEQQYQALAVNYERLRNLKTVGRSNSGHSTSKISKPANNIDFAKYFANKPLSTELSALSTKANASNWVKLIVYESQKVYDQSIITFFVVDEFKLDGITIPKKSQIEGICRLTRSRVHIDFNRLYVENGEIEIEGTAFHLDKSRGIPVRLKRDDNILESLKQHARDAAEIIDPSTVIPNVLESETPVSREFYAEIFEESMIWAKIQKKE